MGQAECKPSAQQCGDAAHICQHDDNNKREVLQPQERQKCNEIIHGKNMQHQPKYDNFLKDQKEKHGL